MCTRLSQHSIQTNRANYHQTHVKSVAQHSLGSRTECEELDEDTDDQDGYSSLHVFIKSKEQSQKEHSQVDNRRALLQTARVNRRLDNKQQPYPQVLSSYQSRECKHFLCLLERSVQKAGAADGDEVADCVTDGEWCWIAFNKFHDSEEAAQRPRPQNVRV